MCACVVPLQFQRLEESLQATRDKLEESRELLKTNENGLFVAFSVHMLTSGLIVVVAPVIGWLNKQINEQMMGGRVPPAGPASLPFSTIRHSSPLTSAPHMVMTSF